MICNIKPIKKDLDLNKIKLRKVKSSKIEK